MNMDEKELRCSSCGKVFMDENSLADHMTLHAALGWLTCDICEMMFQKQSQLEEHERVHRGEKPFICAKCGKTFARSSTLHVHEEIHAAKKPYPCDECGQSFTQNCNLKRHQMTHTRETPFTCVECRRHFALKSDFKKHQMTHTGEKPFCCDQCGRCFTRKHHLQRHQMTHIGEKPFSCDVCGRCFTTKSNLRSHKITHTDEKPFICDSKLRKKCSLWRPFENHGHENLLNKSLKKKFHVQNLFPATSKIREDGNRDCKIPPTELNYHKGIHMHDTVTQFQNTEKGNTTQNDNLINRDEVNFITSNDQTPLYSSTVANVSNPTRELCSHPSTDRQFRNVLLDRDQNICANNESDNKKLKLAPSELKDTPLNPHYEGLLQQDASLPQENSISEASRNWYTIPKERLQNDSILEEGNSCRNPYRTPLESRGCEPGTSSSSSSTLNQENNVGDHHFVCSLCGEKCIARSKLNIHMTKRHGIDK